MLVKEIIRLLHSFPCSFINSEFEFIAHRGINSWFNMKNIQDAEELKYKVLEWFSRPAHKGEYYSKAAKLQEVYDYHLTSINKFLGTNFTTADIALVYQKLGNGVNRSLCKKFVDSGYDLSVLKE